ncbi:ATP-dependent nuclease [Rhodoplanes sp. SY1]|uniref:ATP-dependent nuclease n=1 Tax=Rhodoplanes sp. SY1 TaxID=3166646 RepID=UPI0038B4D4CD
MVGEGIQNLFRMCFSLLSQKCDEVLLVDEPELSLHPQSQRRLYDLLARQAKNRQVIVSTHSVHFVDWRHIKSGTKIYRANLASGQGSVFNSLGRRTIRRITAIAEKDPRNQRAYDALAKEVFFSRGCVLLEGYEDAHILQKYFIDSGNGYIEIFGYGSGGATGILAWLTACNELGIPAVAVFDGDGAGLKALRKAREQFGASEQILLLRIPTPDIRDKYTECGNTPSTRSALDKYGMFTEQWELKHIYETEMKFLVSRILKFLKPEMTLPF